MNRISSLVLLAMLSIGITIPAAFAQDGSTLKIKPGATVKPNKDPKAVKRTASSTESVEKWKRVGLKEYRFSFAHPEEWAANQTEHPDPDIAVDMDAASKGSDFNGIEINREQIETRTPYVLVYAVPKEFQTYADWSARLETDIASYAGRIIGADSSTEYQGYPMYDVTYEVPGMAVVRTIVIYANGMRYGLMYTVLDDEGGKQFKKQMPRFERLLETLQIEKP